MGNANTPENDQPEPEIDPLEADTAAELRLRGGPLGGAELKSAVTHSVYERARNPNTELHLDGEKDTLYNDGLDIEDDSDTLAGTRGTSSGIKP
jgi:hypothetical protein